MLTPAHLLQDTLR